MNELARRRRILQALKNIETQWSLLSEDLAIRDQPDAPMHAVTTLHVSLAHLCAWADLRTRRAEAAEASQGGYRCPVCRQCFGHDITAFQRHAATSARCGIMIRAALDLIDRASKEGRT